MGLFNKLKGPVFLKENSDTKLQLDVLNEILITAPDDVKSRIEQDIKLLSLGITGEKQIAFELRNSHIPMYILHDLYLEAGGLTAQIDYLVITKNSVMIIECKNLIGNIEINNNGDFIRTLEINGKYKKEGIYSPITQNLRHLELIKQLRLNSKGSIISKTVFEKSFNSMYHSIIVLANPKTVLNAKYAKKEIKDQVIRADQLITHIRKISNEKSIFDSLSDKDMEELAKFFLNNHKSNPIDYSEKYTNITEDSSKTADREYSKSEIKIKDTSVQIKKEELIKELKAYRLNKSREENIKPYYIFNDNQMMEIIAQMPKSKELLKSVSGFGNVKSEKYGPSIVNIISKYC